MNRCMFRTAALGASLALFLAGPAAGAGTQVSATPAYRAAFGAPPASQGVDCRAAVVYLPGLGASGSGDRLAPIPLFSVTPGKIVEEAARVLVAGHPEQVRLLPLPRLFPEGTALKGVEVEEGVAVVRIALGTAGQPHPLASQALAHTLTQFEGITGVRLRLGDDPPAPVVRPDPAAVEPPAAPRLLDVLTAVQEGEPPAEIDVLFDRPVEVIETRLERPDGTPIPGKLYTSMFDMAAVLRPEDPGAIREGMALRVTWAVRDRKGRESRGSRTISLRWYRHPGTR
ncbi:GerMN domain-containing protein [Deferrisoma camini]|uniref:GerMN domain-containing protein n=1 Tax=Deferrisoma camini TaxID=1035120 RepID=UPI00046D1AE2|nr:GerMN domain-containing protein [Deferrisoma camini]